jgi:hypothetical protein
MSLQRNIRQMVTVQIWMNYVYRLEGMDSNDLIHSSRDWSKLIYFTTKWTFGYLSNLNDVESE